VHFPAEVRIGWLKNYTEVVEGESPDDLSQRWIEALGVKPKGGSGTQIDPGCGRDVVFRDQS
jgi:hypothetical protein